MVGDGFGVQRFRPQPHLAFGTVGQDVHGSDVASALQDVADLVETVQAAVQDMDLVVRQGLGRAAQAVEQFRVSVHRRVHDHQFRGPRQVQPVGGGHVRGRRDCGVRGLGLFDGHRGGSVLGRGVGMFEPEVRRKQDARLQGFELHLAPGFRPGSGLAPSGGDRVPEQLQHIHILPLLPPGDSKAVIVVISGASFQVPPGPLRPGCPRPAAGAGCSGCNRSAPGRGRC